MKNFFLKLKFLLLSVVHNSGWPSLQEANVLVSRHDADCGYQYSGKVYSPIIDTVVELCFSKGLTVQSIATPFSRLAGGQAFNSPIVLNRPFILIALVVRVLVFFIGRKKSKEWGISKKAEIWLRVLRLVRPWIVIGIQPDVALCRACRVLSIPIYDIQHGVIDPNDKWYGETLQRGVAASDLPSGFLCWDNESAKVLESWAPSKGATVSIVGNPWFQRFQHPDSTDGLVQDAAKQGRIFFDEKPVILIALQWGLHLHYYTEGDFNKVMCNALETVIKRNNKKYNWLLRLHPVQLRGGEGDFCEKYLSDEFGDFSGVEWEKASSMPLPILLSQVDLHITDMSSVVIEASWFGVKSALLNPFLNKGGSIESLYLHERNSGMAKILPQKVESIEVWIEKELRRGRVDLERCSSRKNFNAWLDQELLLVKR